MLLASAFPSSAAVPSFLASLSGPRVHPHFLTNHRHSFLDVLRSDLWLSPLLVSPHAPITTIFFFFFFSLYLHTPSGNEWTRRTWEERKTQTIIPIIIISIYQSTIVVFQPHHPRRFPSLIQTAELYFCSHAISIQQLYKLDCPHQIRNRGFNLHHELFCKSINTYRPLRTHAHTHHFVELLQRSSFYPSTSLNIRTLLSLLTLVLYYLSLWSISRFSLQSFSFLYLIFFFLVKYWFY